MSYRRGMVAEGPIELLTRRREELLVVAEKMRSDLKRASEDLDNLQKDIQLAEEGIAAIDKFIGDK